jgi:hypothetical protein
LPRYLIERNIPGVGRFSANDLRAIARKSRDVIRDMGPDIQWLESYVTADHVFCLYVAPSEEMVREHARRGGFPADRVTKVVAVIDPTTAE